MLDEMLNRLTGASVPSSFAGDNPEVSMRITNIVAHKTGNLL